MRQGRAADRIPGRPAPRNARDSLFVSAVILVVAATVLGGASRENALRLAAVELFALPLAVVVSRRVALGEFGAGWFGAFPFALLAMIVAVPLLQSIPLPPVVWTRLPGQGPRTESLRLAHLVTPWAPLSLAPGQTFRYALALIPPAAMFAATPLLNRTAVRDLAWLWVGLAVVGLVLGLLQIGMPAGGPAYPYRTTNLGALVGLFANRNHEAAYLLALLPFAAALATPENRREPERSSSRSIRTAAWMTWPFILIAVVALGVIRSRAGVILAGPATLAALAVAWRGRRPGRRRWPMAALAVAAGLAVILVTLFAAGPIIDRFAPQATAEFRFEAWPYVIDAARSFLPLGSGLGSFDRVFQAVEPLELVAPTYFNHAHNDYLELWLETGWIGLGMLALFLVWLVPATWRAWRTGAPFACAASAAIALLMTQSFVDYPLRTETLAVLFAYCCGLLARRDRER